MAQALDERIQALPQELQDAILDFTIATDAPDTTFIISKDYKPQLGLCLNRKVREKTARSFYSGTCFRSSLNQVRLFREWISSLSPTHLELIGNLRMVTSTLGSFPDPCFLARIKLRSIVERLADMGIPVNRNVHQVEIWNESSRRGVWQFKTDGVPWDIEQVE